MSDHKHTRMATGKKGAVHLHYVGDSAPSQHAEKRKKVQRRRTGTGMNRRRFNKHWPTKVTVERSYSKSDEKAPWMILLDNVPYYWRTTRAMAIQHAKEIRADIETTRRKSRRK